MRFRQNSASDLRARILRSPAIPSGCYRPSPCNHCPYDQLSLNLSPIVEILEWADRRRFDAIHVDPPGPMGLCGLLVARMLRVPLLGTHHTDFPAYIHTLSGDDHPLTSAGAGAGDERGFYGQLTTVFSRSRPYHTKLKAMGVS